MMRINEQLILEEDYDENYQPTEDGLSTFYVKQSNINETEL